MDLGNLGSFEFEILAICGLGKLVIWEFEILEIWDFGNLQLQYWFCICNAGLAVAKLMLQLQYYFCNCNTSVAVAILVLLGYPNKTNSGSCSRSGLKPELSTVELWLV